MAEQTDEEDGQRPLSPEERTFLRAVRPLLSDPERLKMLDRLLQNEPHITEAAQNYAHLSWGGKLLFRTAIWLTGIVGGVAAYQTMTKWTGFK